MARKNGESWIQYYWRPAMAWQYFAVCVFDFIIAPVLTALYYHHIGAPYVPWVPLTLTNGGLYHLAMGTIIGVSAWSRSKEKIQKMLLDGTLTESEIELVKQELKEENN
jgi:hypothetical protein